MGVGKPTVLLVCAAQQGVSYLLNRLEAQGCECRVVGSYDEARALLRARSFDLILGPIRDPRDTAYSLIDLLVGSRANLFYSYAVEDGCWWLPAVRRGERCFGAPALRPSEFIAMLEQMVDEFRLNQPDPFARDAAAPDPAGARADQMVPGVFEPRKPGPAMVPGHVKRKAAR